MASLGVALVTGCTQGIGKAIATRLVKDGFTLSLNDLRSKDAELRALALELTVEGRKPHVVAGDVSVESDVQRMVASTVEELGSLDVMVANAGICITKSILSTSSEDWDRIAAVNGRGTFLCYKYAAQQMIEQGHGGRIIGAASIAGKQGFASLSAYSASKWAVRGLTQTAAQEFGKYDITVNAYAPGIIGTDMLASIGTALDPNNPNGFYDEYERKTPVRRNGTPSDIASIVSYLASKESGYISGQSMSVNGGLFCD
ncbi:NAD-binding protein [Armillaria luteobubalina]|uniref:NAD-binding protein n=1 Tax=Armillaria luteobubalina TaxID=153913 RepID=A0AA39UP82_9AGAR|nr:NAD-binding protein [Armillaria luteobubalina]